MNKRQAIIVNKRQALFWSLQLWRYLEKTGKSKEEGIPEMIQECFPSVKINWSEIFDWNFKKEIGYGCACCTYVCSVSISGRGRLPHETNCESYCPAFSLWPFERGCLNSLSVYNLWDDLYLDTQNTGDYDMETEIEKTIKKRSGLAAWIADGLEELYLEECRNGN